MEQITFELHDEMTVGALRALAAAVGKRLTIRFDAKVPSASAVPAVRDTASAKQAPAAPAKQAVAEAPARKAAGKAAGKRKRNISPEARAIFARNLIKARAAKVAAREAPAADAGLPKAAPKRPRRARKGGARGRAKAAAK